MEYYSENQEEAIKNLEKMYNMAKEAIEKGASISTASNDYTGKGELEIILRLDYNENPKSGYIE